MENFIFALNATIPVFIVIIAGKLFIKLGIIDEKWTSVSNRLAFYVCMPLVLMVDIATIKVKFADNVKFIVFCFLVTLAMFFIVWILSIVFVKDKTMVGAFAQGSVRGSATNLGIPFVLNIYGNSGMVPMMILASVPIFNAFSVVILTVSANKYNGGQKKALNLKTVLKSIIKNPLIIGIMVGFLVCLLNIDLPPIVLKPVKTIGAAGVPLMLISLGANFKMTDIKSRLIPAAMASLIKLVLLPLAFIPLAVYLGFRGHSLIAILIMLGAPSAIPGYVMAKEMGNDHILMSNIVVLTTLFSSVTFTLWIFALKSLNLL